MGQLTLQKALAGLGWLAGCAACCCCCWLPWKRGRMDGTGLDWNCGLSRQEIASKHLRAGNAESWGRAPFPIPGAPVPIGCGPLLPLLPSLGRWAGPAEFRLCMPSDMQVMPALSLG